MTFLGTELRVISDFLEQNRWKRMLDKCETCKNHGNPLSNEELMCLNPQIYKFQSKLKILGVLTTHLLRPLGPEEGCLQGRCFGDIPKIRGQALLARYAIHWFLGGGLC